MPTYTKTANQTALANQRVTASTVVVGSAFDLSGKMGGAVHVRFGRRVATASTAGANLRLEVSFKTSGTDAWSPWAIFTTGFAACSSTTTSAQSNIGTNTLTLTSATGFAAGDVIYIDRADGDGEWARVKSVSGSVITLEDNLTATVNSGVTVSDSAEIFSPVNLPDFAIRGRFVADMALFTQNSVVECYYTTIDSIA
jgi:hypothetical protein